MLYRNISTSESADCYTDTLISTSESANLLYRNISTSESANLLYRNISTSESANLLYCNISTSESADCYTVTLAPVNQLIAKQAALHV